MHDEPRHTSHKGRPSVGMRGALAAGLWVFAACGEPAREAPPDVTLAYPDALSVDAAGPEYACEQPSDCPAIDDCCIRADCLERACSWYVVPDCCAQPGACAVSSPQYTGVCAAQCVAGGCEARLRLNDVDCGESLLSLLPAMISPTVSVDRRGAATRLGWYLDLRVPFAGLPSWRFADAVCDVVHNGPLSNACEPLGTDSEGFSASLTFDAVELPANAPLVLEGALTGVPSLLSGDSGAPSVQIAVVFPSGATAPIWTNGLADSGAVGVDGSARVWRPFAADLSGYAGQTVGLRVTVSASAGPTRRDPGVGVAGLRVRSPCASEREPSEATACAAPLPVQIQPTDDIIYRLFPKDAETGCVPCPAPSECAAAASCLVSTCEANVCAFDGTASSCCAGDPAAPDWLTALADWALDGVAWREIAGPGEGAPRTFQFPLLGQTGTPRGAIASPAFYLPTDSAALSFEVWLETEWDDATGGTASHSVDRLWVEQRTADESTAAPIVTLWDSTQIGGSTRGRWQLVRVPLTGAAGSVASVAFLFDAGDADFNEYGGAWIKNLGIGDACSAP